MKSKPIHPIFVVCLCAALVLYACNRYNPNTQALADALGATPDNTLANLKLTSNIVDRYQWIYFKAPANLIDADVECVVKMIDPFAVVQPGVVWSGDDLPTAVSWGDTLTMSWSKADPKNLRVIAGKDILHDAVQYREWYVNWGENQRPDFPSVSIHFVEYSPTKFALEMDGHPITGPIIILETGRQ